MSVNSTPSLGTTSRNARKAARRARASESNCESMRARYAAPAPAAVRQPGRTRLAPASISGLEARARIAPDKHVLCKLIRELLVVDVEAHQTAAHRQARGRVNVGFGQLR